MPGLPPAADWWRERGEPRALTALAMLAVSLPPLALLGLIGGAEARRAALLLAWAAALLLAARLPRLLARSPRGRSALLAAIGGGALACALALPAGPTRAQGQAGLTFKATPRIPQSTFSRLLADAGSPAAPHANELYQIIVSYGLDPAVALAFFRHESSFCTAGGCANADLRNWGMLRRPIQAARSSGVVNGFARYNSWQDGVRDWCELILGRYVGRGLETVEKAVPVYAPRADGNAPDAYVSSIRRMVAAWSGQILAAPADLHSYTGGLDEALLSETFLASDLEYHPHWAFHTFLIDESAAGRALGAPLDESRVITVQGQRYAVQVFALDTLYTPLAAVEAETNWGDVRRMSALLRGKRP